MTEFVSKTNDNIYPHGIQIYVVEIIIILMRSRAIITHIEPVIHVITHAMLVQPSQV